MSEILNNLNNEQRIPASVTEGAVLVTAGAGSGKTRMLTHRIAHLICDLGVNPYNILAITFTNKAANEMKERLEKMIGKIDGMWVSTFHAMCSKILRMYADVLGYTKSFTIYGDAEKERLIKRLLSDKDSNVEPTTISWHISNAKNHLLSPNDYAEQIVYERRAGVINAVYSEYEKEMKRCNALDFDDLLCKTYELFLKHPEICEIFQNKFKYIHVDEFQDTNEAQYKIVKLLAQKFGNIFVVGDEDQCIYSWRGAEAENVVNFTKDFANCQVFKLEQNYRSTKKIIERANLLISRNQNRLSKKLWTENGDGPRVEEFSCYNDLEEAEYVCQTIKSLMDYGYNYRDFAVLMRVNALSRVLEEKLITYGIPYKVYGGFKFFERKEIKDTIAYLRVIANPSDDDAFIRTLSFPKKGIGEVTIATVRELALEVNQSMFSLIKDGQNLTDALKRKFSPVKELFDDLTENYNKLGLYDFISYVIERVGIKNALFEKAEKTEEEINKALNIDDFLVSVKQFEEANDGATLDDFLQSITLMRDVDTLLEEDNFASLMTIHSAKGLEFKCVFIVGLVEGLFPLSRAITSADPNELEEERRLMYVAITRAQERLFLTYPKTRFSFETKRSEYCAPSRFLKESSVDYIEELNNSAISRTKLNLNEMRTARIATAGTKVNIMKTSSESSAPTSPKPKLNFSDFKKGTRVLHPHFGEGVVIIPVTDFASGYITVRFDSVGMKNLSLKYADLKIID